MIRKGLLCLCFLAAAFFFGGCYRYPYIGLRGSVGYGEASAIPFSQSYDYYPAYPYYDAYPYPPYYRYDYYYLYPYPYFFGSYYFHHRPSVKIVPAPGRRFRSNGDSSSSSSSQPTKGKRGFKR